MENFSHVSQALNSLIDNIFLPSVVVNLQVDIQSFIAMLDRMGINYEEIECDGLIEVILFADDRNSDKLCQDSKRGHEPYFQFDPISKNFISFGVSK